MPTTSVLNISGVGLPDYSVRGATQTLAPIDAAKNYRRTVNGRLEDVSDQVFRQYRSTITCTDQAPPEFAGLWPGSRVTVDCITELAGTPNRETVATRTVDGFTFWRPRLVMVVTNFEVQTDEYGAEVGWTMELEEYEVPAP